MSWLNLEDLWEIAKSLLAGAVVAGGVIWRSWRHFDGRFEEIDRSLRREAGRVDLLEAKVGALATREDLAALRTEVAQVDERMKGQGQLLATMARQIEMLVEHEIKGRRSP